MGQSVHLRRRRIFKGCAGAALCAALLACNLPSQADPPAPTSVQSQSTSVPLPAAPVDTAVPPSPTAVMPTAPAPTVPAPHTSEPAAPAGLLITPASLKAVPTGPVYDPAMLEMIARLNAYRVANGIWPLQMNKSLQLLAEDQAAYLAGLPPSALPEGEALHRDARGADPMLRAAKAGWPHYNNPQQIAIGENAYIGKSLDAAMDFWMRSDIHNRTMLHTAFREVGVAIVPYYGDLIYIVTFGSRPGVLPAMVDPVTTTLYLTSEQYKWSKTGDWIKDVTEVRVEDGITEPAWARWKLVQPFDAKALRLRVRYSDGSYTAETSVDATRDIAWLPTNLSMNRAAPPPVSDNSPPETAQVTAPTPRPSPSPTPSLTPPTAIPAPSAGPANLSITYNAQSLTVIPLQRPTMDLSHLELTGGGHRLPTTLWQGQWLTVGLNVFPGGDCLQVWSQDGVDPGTPTGCRIRQSVIFLLPQNMFWRYFDFEVRWRGQVITTCQLGAGTCEVTLP